MILSLKIKCRCDSPHALRVKRPGFCESSLAGFTCKSCKSTLLASVRRPKSAAARDKGLYEINTRVTHASPMLQQLLHEEAAWNALTPEEQEKANDSQASPSEAP